MQTSKILLLSGIHGDEFGVISSVNKYVKKQGSKLPSYIYIPEVSPSAVTLKTRNNIRNIDLNRSFIDDTKDEEILDLKQKLDGISFSSAFTFHEDCNREKEFYMYSSQKIDPTVFSLFNKQLQSIEIELFNGIDDPSDFILNNHIDDGLLVSSIEKEKKGTLWPWLKKNNDINYCIDFEIPGKASQEKKDTLVQILFDCLIF